MDINVEFANDQQRTVYYAIQRNQCFSGGFNNGKTFIACLKALCLLLTFPGYRIVIARQKFTDLRKTTMQTFLKLCPAELIASHNEQDGITSLVNSSTIFWLHLDKVDESTLRGLEINAVIVDQAEEMDEKVYDVLDARIGRWKGSVVPDFLLNLFPHWPRDRFGQPEVPSYHLLLCNPDSLFHFIYRKYHPDSNERYPDHFFIEGQWDQTLGSEESYQQALRRDKDYVDRFVRGKWGLSDAQIHVINESCILNHDENFVKNILANGNLYRTLDHGDSAPTCCLWWSAFKGVYVAYREYYVANRLISQHRKNIYELSVGEDYSNNWADPAIEIRVSQREGGFWTVADEYRTRDIDGPPLTWTPADNNEYATRNRINELLTPSDRFKHPVTGESPAPGIYFIRSSRSYPNGCVESIKQLGSQRKELLGTVEGKNVYSNDRDESIPDHAYDPIRYFVAMHPWQRRDAPKNIPARSFARFNKLVKRYQQLTAAST